MDKDPAQPHGPPMPPPMRELVFISYSHKDAKWRDRLLILLQPFMDRGRLQVWADPYIEAGSLWRRDIENALARSAVGVILLTPHLLASKFIADVEIPLLLRAARGGQLKLLIVPVLAHPSGSTRFTEGDLLDFQWAWPQDKPIDELPVRLRNRALVTVTETIVRATGSVQAESSPAATYERSASAAVMRQARRAVVHGVPRLPPNYLRWDQTHDMVKTTLLGTSAVVGVSARAASLGVHGQGGLGKTVAAQAIAHDDEVVAAFPDGIFWITVGQQPRLESLQADLAGWADAPLQIDNVASGARYLREVFRGKACLVVLDDVWQFSHAKAFDVLDGASRLLVTTRDRSILTALGARDLPLDRLSPDLGLELLAAWAGVSADALPREATEVAREVEFLPLALSLAGAQIRDRGSWGDLLAALRAGKLDYLDHPYGSVFRSLEASLDALEADAAKRYLELAVFPEDVEVPVIVVEDLWGATAGLTHADSQKLIRTFASRNLLRVIEGNEPTGAIALHDLQHDFVRLLVPNVVALHGHLIDAWRTSLPTPDHATTDADRWAALSFTPGYRWQFLAHHLKRAGRGAELGDLLTSLDWMSAKLARFPLAALVTDYREVTTDAGVRLVRDALVLSTHVLTKDPSALAAQLAGRVVNPSDPRIAALLDDVHATLRHQAQLRPTDACLTRPGGPLLQTFEGHRNRVCAVTVLPDGQRALSASDDGALKLWDLATGQDLQTVEGHTDWVGALAVATAIALLPDGQRALSGSHDGTLNLWELATGQVLQTFKGHTRRVTTVTVLPDGQRALSGSGNALKLWDLATGQDLQTLSDADLDLVWAVTVLSDGQRALSGSFGGTLKLWDLATGQVLQIFEGHTDWVTAVTALPDGQRALFGGHDGTLKLWDLATGQVLQTFEGHTDSVTTVTALPHGQRALSGSADRTLKLWDLATGQVPQTFERHTRRVTAVTMLPDGERALSSSGDRTLKLWDLATGQVLQTFGGHSDSVMAVTVLSDGERALSGSDDQTLKLWDLATGKVLQTLEGHTRTVTAVTMLPDGQRALSGSDDRTLKLWDLATGQVLQTFEGHTDRVMAVTMLPDGHRALLGTLERTLKLWDLTTGQVLQTFEGHADAVTAVTVLPDGERALSSSGDRTLKLWDLATGQVLQTFEGHADWVMAVTVLPDGQRALSGSHDSTLKLWDLATGQVQSVFYDDADVTCLSEVRRGRVVVGNALGRVYVLEIP